MKRFIIAIAVLLSISPVAFTQDTLGYKPGELSEAELTAFRKEALKRVEALGDFLRTITNKSIDPSVRIDAVSAACRLFVDEQQIVEVSSKYRTTITKYKIRQYLNALRVRNDIGRVEIKWYNINYIRDFKLGTDGKYYATITIFQKYGGYSPEGLLQYEDITQKDVGVVLSSMGKKIGDRVVNKWDVLLRDISVVETK
jgi:hypothetical protein